MAAEAAVRVLSGVLVTAAVGVKVVRVLQPLSRVRQLLTQVAAVVTVSLAGGQVWEVLAVGVKVEARGRQTLVVVAVVVYLLAATAAQVSSSFATPTLSPSPSVQV
jgi:hypothetical protein